MKFPETLSMQMFTVVNKQPMSPGSVDSMKRNIKTLAKHRWSSGDLVNHLGGFKILNK